MLFLGTSSLVASNLNQIESQFSEPPDDARIMVRWWWFGPAVTKSEIEREMVAMKAGGIGGFEVQATYPLQLDGNPPGAKNLKFLSAEYLDAIAFTAAKAKELGLRMSLTLGSGWPYGGPQFTSQDSAIAIQTLTVPIPAGQRNILLPPLGVGQELIAAFVKVGGEYREVAVVDQELRVADSAADATQVELFVSRSGIMKVKRPALGAEGNVIDHYSPPAVEKFIKEIAEPVIAACGPAPIYSLFCDSLEVSGENWTSNLLPEFKRRRGYDLRPLLPALFEDVGPKTLDIRHDWGRTMTELFNDNFNARFTRLAHDHRTRFRIQGYGTPPAALYSYAYCDLPEGEQWTWKKFTDARWASSASHLLGYPVTSSETFTYLHSPVFRATPLDMKAEANLHFLSGINQLICHGWPYSPPSATSPGWSFYAAGVFNDHNPWWIVMPDVTKYLQRVSYILRQGTPANDVAVFLPNSDAWSHLNRGFGMNAYFAGKVGGLVRSITDAGYNLDFFDDQLLEMRGAVAGDRLAFGDVRYRVVILPGVERILPATIVKLEAFARNGGIVIATQRLPELAPGYQATDGDHRLVRETARRLFQGPGALGMFVSDETKLGEALGKRLVPDVRFSEAAAEIGVVHRHLQGGEIYFVANTSNQPVSVHAGFRVTDLQPESWDPMNGQVSPAAIVGRSAEAITLSLDLAPYGSTVVVFAKRTPAALASPPRVAVVPPAVDISTGWLLHFGQEAPVTLDKLASWPDLPGKRNFSGMATYEKTVVIAPEMLQAGLMVSVDFGRATISQEAGVGQGFRAALSPPIREAAVLYLNERRVGSVWSPPYAIDVSGKLKVGENKIRIEVANLAVNSMAGTKQPNYDYEGVTREFGDRFRPQELTLIQSVPSGLLGPVRIVATAGSVKNSRSPDPGDDHIK